MSEEIKPLIPLEGWHVMHLFYSIDYAQWEILSDQEQREAKTKMTELVHDIRSHKDTHLLTFAVATFKADIAFMLLTPDLQDASKFEKKLSLALGADILQPCYSYLSLTESSEYTTTSEQYAADTLIAEKGMKEGTDEFLAALKEFDSRMEHYMQHRLYPVLPDWPVMCFYPMSKKRSGEDNWYSLDHAARKELMAGHAKIGRTYSGKILQLITGSTGLEEYEWGVTLLAHDTHWVKDIVYKMRFDEVSAKYGEFGDFYICMNLGLSDLFDRVCI